MAWVSRDFLIGQNVRIAFLRVEATVGASVHTIFGEDHKCAYKLKELWVVADGEAERRKQN